MNRALTLWEADNSLTVALDNCKALLRPIDYLTSIWPCNGELIATRYRCEFDHLYGRTKGSLHSFTQASGRCLPQCKTSSPSPNGSANSSHVLVMFICSIALLLFCFRALCSSSTCFVCPCRRSRVGMPLITVSWNKVATLIRLIHHPLRFMFCIL